MTYSDPTHRLLDQIATQLRRIADCMEAEQKKPKLAQKPVQAVEDAGFKAFWSLYPRKVAKPAALRAWKALNRKQQQVAERVLPDWIKAWQNTETQFIPHASTWLNQRRFEDPIQQAVPVQQENLNKLDDNELNARAEKLGIRTVGLTRFDIIDRIQTR